MFRSLTLLTALTCAATTAQADLAVTFTEGAPKDRFTFTNQSACALTADVVLDLSGSAAGLIFDVTGSGAGVQVFQPFQIVVGAEALPSLPKVADGDSRVVLDIKGLAPGGSLAFTIDVDDTLGGREITVNGAEIEGARVQSGQAEARFSDKATALLALADCTS